MAAVGSATTMVMTGPARTAGCCLTVMAWISLGSRYRLIAAGLPEVVSTSLTGRRLPSCHHLGGYAVLCIISQPPPGVMPSDFGPPGHRASRLRAGKGCAATHAT